MNTKRSYAPPRRWYLELDVLQVEVLEILLKDAIKHPSLYGMNKEDWIIHVVELIQMIKDQDKRVYGQGTTQDASS